MPKLDLLQGTLDLIVLKALTQGPQHGFQIARWIQMTTDDALQVEEGSLYPSLYRMEKRGWVASDLRLTENNRKARYYRLTRAGSKQLGAEEASWDHFTQAVSKILRTA